MRKIENERRYDFYDHKPNYNNLYNFSFHRYVVRECLRGTSRERSSDARLACGQPGQPRDQQVIRPTKQHGFFVDPPHRVSLYVFNFKCVLKHIFSDNQTLPLLKLSFKKKSHNTFRPIVRAIKKQKQKWVPFRWEKYFE